MSTTGSRHEGPPIPQQGGLFSRLREATRALSHYHSDYERHSRLGSRVFGGLESAASLGRNLSQILPTAETLMGVENPREELGREIGVLAVRLARLIPDEELGARRRGGDHTPTIQKFQAGFVEIVEELVNGTTAGGEQTQLSLLSRIVQHQIHGLPDTLQRDLFAKGQDGRQHVRGDQEISVIANLRKRPIVGGIINTSLKPENPLTAQRAIGAFAAEVAIGLVGGHYKTLPDNAPELPELGNTWNWLYRHKGSFDRELLGLLDSTKVKVFEGLAPQSAEAITQINDIRKFLVKDLPELLPQLLHILPSNPQEVAGFRQLLASARAIATPK